MKDSFSSSIAVAVGLRHHPCVGHNRDLGELVGGQERANRGQHRMDLCFVALERLDHQRETGRVGQQADGDLWFETPLFGEPWLAEPIALVGLEAGSGLAGLAEAGHDAPDGRAIVTGLELSSATQAASGCHEPAGASSLPASGSAVTEDYPGTAPWRFTGGTIHRVVIDVSGEPYLNLEREAQAMLSRE